MFFFYDATNNINIYLRNAGVSSLPLRGGQVGFLVLQS